MYKAVNSGLYTFLYSLSSKIFYFLKIHTNTDDGTHFCPGKFGLTTTDVTCHGVKQTKYQTWFVASFLNLSSSSCREVRWAIIVGSTWKIKDIFHNDNKFFWDKGPGQTHGYTCDVNEAKWYLNLKIKSWVWPVVHH